MESKSENNLAKKFFEYAIGSGLTLILGFISSPIITRLINPEEFGKFSMFNLFTSILSILLAVGMDQAFVRFYYEEDEENRILLLRKTIRYPLMLSFLFMILMLIFRQKLSIYLFQEYNIIVIILILINCFILVINRYGLLTLRMVQNGKMYSLVQVLQKGLYIFFVIAIFLCIRGSYLVLLIATVVSNIIATLIAILSYKEFWFEKIDKNSKLKHSMKEMALYGVPLMFTALISWSFQSSDKLFIKHFSNYTEVGIYSSAFSIIALLNQIQVTFLNFWVPVAYEHFKNDEDNKAFYCNVFEIITIIMFLIAIGLILFKDIVVLLLGSQYREASFIMPFLLFMPVMNTISEVTVMGIGFMKKSRYHIYITSICALVNIIANFILVPILGARGAAITTGMTYILFFVLRTYISNKLYYIDYRLKKFYVLTLSTMLLVTYSTFNNVDIITIIGCILITIMVVVLYKETFIKYIKIAKTKFIK